MKYFAFRFDVDTHKCLSIGTPRLLSVAKELGVSFTFFVNCGKAVDQTGYIKRVLKRKNETGERVSMLTPFQKLGAKHYIKAAVMNPSVIKGSSQVVKKMLAEGHEVGLHGGRNHDTWHYNASMWSKKTVTDEIQWGIEKLRNIDKNMQLHGFSSPGWTGSELINRVVRKNKFSYIADVHTNKPYQTIKKVDGLFVVPTNIVGEPGGVGYIEHCRARGLDDAGVLNDFTKKLAEREKLAIVYDHPYVAGIKEIDLVRKMLQIAQKKGFTITSIHNIVNAL